MPTGCITFTRQCIGLDRIPIFEESKKKMLDCVIKSDGIIEDCEQALQLDFANKYIGGGVLNSGCVQEEIRFLICPELLVSLLFCEKMEANECILIKGAERYSSYNGYGDTLEWSSNYVDKVDFDQWNRRNTEILAIDALNFRYQKLQFSEENVERELKKSFSGFTCNTDESIKQLHDYKSKIATGNWGCGAFKGNRQLKFLIQLMSASQCERDLIYFTFNDRKTADSLELLLKIIKLKNLNVGDVYELLVKYCEEVKQLRNADLTQFDLCAFFKTYFNLNF